MMRGITAGAVAMLVAFVSVPAQAQQAPAIGATKVFDVPIDHVGMIVRDIDKSARAYADAFGLPVPAIQTQTGLVFPADYRGDRKASTKTASFQLTGVSFTLVQPVGGASPWRDHLDKYGEGLHHIALHGVKDVAGSVAEAVALGGKQVTGGPGSTTASVDLRELLGFTVVFSSAPGTRRTESTGSGSFADNRVSYISLIVPDIEKAMAAFGKLTGSAMPKIADPKITYPENFTGNRAAHPRLAMFPMSGISVAYTSPVDGPSPWSDSVKKSGPTMHHLGILIKGMADQIGYFEKKGGKLVIGGANLGYCWIDMPQLSTVFELNGK